MSKPSKRVKTGGRGKAANVQNNTNDILSGEEQQLWSYVIRGASPLKAKAAGRVAHSAESSGGDEEFASLLGCSPRRIQNGNANATAMRRSDEPGTTINGAPGARAPVNRSPGGSANFDRRSARKIARGAIEIDARIDLHGMRQREAHGALRRFLFNAHAKGHRIVLVITGKGNPMRGKYRGAADDEWHTGFGLNEEPGVLRRNVPQWLAEGDLSAIVAAYTNAHTRHGGDGALYIHLRKRKTLKPK